MSEPLERVSKFVAYAESLIGDEKGEAQVFCDRLFQAFGHQGYKEAGATLEFRIKKESGTSFADLVWKPRLLLEMKKRGEKLELHYQQAFDYWINAVPNRPRYVVLCNFDEFWIYDFDRQLHEPIDQVKLADLPHRGRVTKRPIFEFVSTEIRPNDALTVFAHDDDYSFGILQSDIHWQWFIERCSTLKSDFRYTSNTVFDSFPWPQKPDLKAVRKVADASVALRDLRNSLRKKHSLTFRELYRLLDEPGDHALKKAHTKLDEAVRAAYGMPKDVEPLSFLLELNLELAGSEKKEKVVMRPGLPSFVKDKKPFVTSDCVSI